jgi:hypothetical protein
VTLNAAWVSGGSAFLVSDTSSTSRRPAREEVTSLGQWQARPDGFAVEEVAAKVVPLGTHAALALCGDGSAGAAFASSVRGRLARGTDLDDALLAAGHSLHHQSPPSGAFVATVARWSDEPTILQYRSETLELRDITAGAPVVEGSLRGALLEEVKGHLGGLPGPVTHGQVTLAAALAVLQGFAASEDLVSQSVAGVFYGLRIAADGVHWQPHVIYVLYDPLTLGSQPFQLVSASVLDDVCVVGSSFSKQVRCLVHPGHEQERAAWMQRWASELSTEAALRRARLIAFIATTSRAITILNNDGQHLRPEYDGALDLRVSPALARHLRASPVSSERFAFSLGVPDE